ncbi:MAG: formylglycine-generating enzyme family protein, partial [Treponema sp.]|nr:formylglycine-generating enzyme family protein [Treponema sp.]
FVWFTNKDVFVFQSRLKDMVLMPGGTFSMGSPATEPAREPNEGPRHEVTVSSFYMGKKEVTVGEFRQFVNDAQYTTTAQGNGGGRVVINDNWEEKADASWENPYFSQDDRHPAVLVSWYDAVEYCNWRSAQKGLSLAYSIDGSTVTCNWDAEGYRLPTEAEWEYACRADTDGPFSTGDNITTSLANYDGNSPYNNNAKGEYRQASTRTLSFAPNSWGLYDMHGNVYEWCWDVYGNYGAAAQTDPKGPAAGPNRVARGGSWYRSGKFARSASRAAQNPAYRDSALGFRLVLPNRERKTAENK